jgi:tyrosyl-tRNA synthetase
VSPTQAADDTTFFGELGWRGLVADFTRVPATGEAPQPQLPERLAAGPLTLYCGFDPSADSLHVGSLVPLLALRRFQLAGHSPVAVAGGATGAIGDPSGKSQERNLLDREQIEANIAAIRPQLEQFLDFDPALPNAARLVDNADWFAGLGYLDFLREVGKHFTVNQMVAKESVRARMEDRDVGISYTEFSYMLLQAYDFLVLADTLGCELQIGGSDQWGNITAGIDLIRKRLGRHAYGMTLPLVTKSDGTKFGKTEAGTVWLDPARTSVYQFYQFWVNTGDSDVVRYLKLFSFLTRPEIEAMEAAAASDPGDRAAQKALAASVTGLVHGEDAARDAAEASETLFGGALDGISESALAMLESEIPSAKVSAADLVSGFRLGEALVATGLVSSNSQARKDIQGGGVSCNGTRTTDFQRALGSDDFLFGRYLLLRKGKRHFALLVREG